MSRPKLLVFPAHFMVLRGAWWFHPVGGVVAVATVKAASVGRRRRGFLEKTVHSIGEDLRQAVLTGRREEVWMAESWRDRIMPIEWADDTKLDFGRVPGPYSEQWLEPVRGRAVGRMHLPPDAPLEIEFSLSKVDVRQLAVFWGPEMAERWGQKDAARTRIPRINTKAGREPREDGGVPFFFSITYQGMLLKPGKFSQFVHYFLLHSGGKWRAVPEKV